MLLYDHRASTNALKVRFLLAELGVAHDVEEVALDGPRPAEYLATHPFGLIPALRDGDLVITESNTMLRYLAEREDREDLRGDTPVRRARVDNLLDTLSLELRPALWGLEEIERYGAEVSTAEHDARRGALQSALEAYEQLLDADGPYALGAFTIADCAIAGRALHVPALSVDTQRLPRLTRALNAARARPAYDNALDG